MQKNRKKQKSKNKNNIRKIEFLKYADIIYIVSDKKQLKVGLEIMDQIKIGKYIQKLRKDKELTQKQLADKLGIKCYDQELIIKMAEQSGFCHDYIKEGSE